MPSPDKSDDPMVRSARGETPAHVVGAAMRKARKDKGIGLRAMARKLGYSAHSNLSEYETGNRLASDDVLKGYERVCELRKGSLHSIQEAALDAAHRRPSD